MKLEEGRKSNILKTLSQLHAYLKRYQDLDKTEAHFEQRLEDAGCTDMFAAIDDVLDIVETGKAADKARLLNKVYKQYFPKTAKKDPASDEELEAAIGEEEEEEEAGEVEGTPQMATYADLGGQGAEGKTLGDIRKSDQAYMSGGDDEDWGEEDDESDIDATNARKRESRMSDLDLAQREEMYGPGGDPDDADRNMTYNGGEGIGLSGEELDNEYFGTEPEEPIFDPDEENLDADWMKESVLREAYVEPDGSTMPLDDSEDQIDDQDYEEEESQYSIEDLEPGMIVNCGAYGDGIIVCSIHDEHRFWGTDDIEDYKKNGPDASGWYFDVGDIEDIVGNANDDDDDDDWEDQAERREMDSTFGTFKDGLSDPDESSDYWKEHEDTEIEETIKAAENRAEQLREGGPMQGPALGSTPRPKDPKDKIDWPVEMSDEEEHEYDDYEAEMNEGKQRRPFDEGSDTGWGDATPETEEYDDLGETDDFETPERSLGGTRHPEGIMGTMNDEVFEYIDDIKSVDPEISDEEIIDEIIKEFSGSEHRMQRDKASDILSDYEAENNPTNEEATSGQIEDEYADLAIDGVPDSEIIERLIHKYKLTRHELEMMLGEEREAGFDSYESNEDEDIDDTEQEFEDDNELNESIDDLGDVGDFPRPKAQDLEFESEEDFEAFHDAKDWLQGRGFSVGQMCRDAPIGFKEGDWAIAKWFNLEMKDKAQLDGYIIGDKRHGPIKIKFGNAARATEDLINEVPERSEKKPKSKVLKLRGFPEAKAILPDDFKATALRIYKQLAAGRSEDSVISNLIDKGYTDKEVDKVFDYLAFKNPLAESMPGPSDQHAGQPTQPPAAAPPTPYDTTSSDLTSSPDSTTETLPTTPTAADTSTTPPSGNPIAAAPQSKEMTDFLQTLDKAGPDGLESLTKLMTAMEK